MRIYVDNAATTKPDERVVKEMLPYYTEYFGNPSSIYAEGAAAKRAVETAREKVATAIGAEPREIYFTGSGTEADNWALRSVAKAYAGKGKHIITSAVEHHAVLHTCQELEKDGFRVTYLPVDEYGRVSADELEKAIDDETILVSIMFANNEIGTIMPIKQIGEVCKKHGVIFHTDAVQAIGMVDIDVNELNIDMLSLTAHKFHGPKGVGALYARKGINLKSFITGGAQERGKRAATENVAGIVGMGKAIELATENIPEKQKKLTELRDYYIKKVLDTIPYSRLNGHPTERLSGNTNISFQFIEGEGMLLRLDMKGIAASSGSACTSGSLDPSHVLLAIGLKHEEAHGSLRVTFDESNTKEQVDYIVDSLKDIVELLRSMSPLYEDFVKGKK
ncbi:MAG: cysteine desulfurase NifS [Clostridiales bacterium]|nr:cysteine desulfurase NifS [Clostridiales bacterium]